MRKFSLKKLIVGVVVLAGIAGLIHNIGREYQASHPPQTDLSRLTPAQALAHCRAIWTAGQYDQPPLALSWHPNGVDWYVLEGVDAASMRHYGCTARGVEQGGRYRRPAQASAPSGSDEGGFSAELNLFDRAASLKADHLLAYEAMLKPGGAVVERLWTAGADPRTQPAATPDFPALFTAPPTGLAMASHLLLVPLARKNWVRKPKDVFDLLAGEAPPPVRIAALSFNESTVNLTIVGPTSRSEGDSPAPYGTARFDEYGIRSMSGWNPQDAVPGFCQQGRELAEVAARFWQLKEANEPGLLVAAFGCTSGETGEAMWKLRLPNRRDSTQGTARP